MDRGWIKIHRSLVKHPIWLHSTPEQCKILITLLMMANYYPNSWDWGGKQFEVKEGQFVTSFRNLAKECGDGISLQNVRTALKRFEKLGFLTHESTHHGLLITIENWGLYQGCDEEPNTQSNTGLTHTQHTPNTGLTPNKEYKNIRNKELKEKDIKRKFGEYGRVRLTDKEKDKLVTDLGEKTFSDLVQRLDEYIEMTGKVYKNHSATIRNWHRRNNENKSDKDSVHKEYSDGYAIDF